MTLGLGATTRIGFWLWYVVPIAALLGGRPALGAAVYGLYGLVRGGAAGILILELRRHPGGGPLAGRLLDRVATARALAAGQLVLVGLAVAVAVGR